MDLNTVGNDTINTSCDFVENMLDETTENVSIQSEITAGTSCNVIEVVGTDRTRQEITEDGIGYIDVLVDNNDQHSNEKCKTASGQQLNSVEEPRDISSNVLDKNRYHPIEEELQRSTAPDLSEFCGKTTLNEESDDSLEAQTTLPIHSVCSGDDSLNKEVHDMVFELEEDLNDGIETVEVMTLSEFIGCIDIEDHAKYLLDPKAKQPFAEYGTDQQDLDNTIPKGSVSNEDMPVTGATGIQTITRKDSETDNVVVIIRPRSDSPSGEKYKHAGQLGVSDSHITPALDFRIIPSPNSLQNADRTEHHFSHPYRIHSDSESCYSNKSNNIQTQDSNLCETGFKSIELGENCSRMSPKSTSNERKCSESGARRKRWVRHNSTDTSKGDTMGKSTSFEDIKHSKKSNEIDIDKLDPEWDAEDKLIWELLSSMKSVTKRPDEHSEVGRCDVVSGRFENAVKSDDQDRSDAIDSDNSLISSELLTSLDSFGEKERERLISEKLQKRQAGGVTCITFLSPGHKRQVDTFTPIHCKEPLKLDAKGFFQKGFESSRKDLSVHTKDIDQTNHRTINSSKLNSPKLYLS